MAWFPKLAGFPFFLRSKTITSDDESMGMLKELLDGASAFHLDELTVKKCDSKASPGWDGGKERYEKNDGGEKGVRVRVKLKLTKKEAVRLLLKCKEGGALEFRDATHELGRIPENRIVSVDVISRGIVALGSIPEEKDGLSDDLQA